MPANTLIQNEIDSQARLAAHPCHACLTSDRPEKRACALLRLVAEGLDPSRLQSSSKSAH